MKIHTLLIIVLTALFCSCESKPKDTDKTSTTGYDSSLAATLGADQYGMKTYVLAFLYRGDNRSLDTSEAIKLQRAHMANINRLADEGKLVLAGPFIDTGALRGIYIFDVETVAAAKVLTETDPSIQAGALRMELIPWYGSASLKKVAEIHERIARENP